MKGQPLDDPSTPAAGERGGSIPALCSSLTRLGLHVDKTFPENVGAEYEGQCNNAGSAVPQRNREHAFPENWQSGLAA